MGIDVRHPATSQSMSDTVHWLYTAFGEGISCGRPNRTSVFEEGDGGNVDVVMSCFDLRRSSAAEARPDVPR